MKSRTKARRILIFEAIGFGLIILLSWLNELLSLPTYLFGGEKTGNWREAFVETMLALLVWLVLFTLTRRLLARLYYLEGFLRVCSWCRKINHDNQWVPIEEYFRKGFETKTSHAICPECAAKMMDADHPPPPPPPG